MKIKKIVLCFILSWMAAASNGSQDSGESFLKNKVMEAVVKDDINALLTHLDHAKSSGVLDSVVNATFHKGITPLMVAVYKNNEKMVRYLLEYGASPDMQNDNKNTALCLAIERNNKDIVGVLLGYGRANPNFVCRNEYPLTIAIENDSWEIANLLQIRGALIGPNTSRVSNPVYAVISGWDDNEFAWKRIKLFLNVGGIDVSNIVTLSSGGAGSLFLVLVLKNKLYLMKKLLSDSYYTISNDELRIGLQVAIQNNLPEMITLLEQEVQNRKPLLQKLRDALGI